MAETVKRALFLVHNYNDIDHMTPVIDTLMRSGRWNCAVLSYPLATAGSFDFATDWRLAYLRDAHGITVDRLETVASSAATHIKIYQFRETLQHWCDVTPAIGKAFGRDLRGLLPWFLVWRFYDRLLRFYFEHVSALGRVLFRRYRPDVVAVDWGQSHGVIAPLLFAASRRGIPILQLPHGAWTYEGIYSHSSQIDTGKLTKRTRLGVIEPAAMVIDNVYKAMRSIVQGVPKDKLRFLGLARFTPQWHRILGSLPRGDAGQPSTGKPRLVWYTTWLMASKLQAVDETLAVLEDFADRIDIVLKVHTRNPGNEQLDYGRRLRPNSPIRLVANEVESFAMTLWADIVLITQSSIVYDAFLAGKPVLYLKYTHDFECIWEKDGVGDVLLSASDLRSKLTALVEGRYRTDYSEADLARFLRNSVCGGLEPEAVLPAYVSLFDQAADGLPLTAGSGYDAAVAAWKESGREIRPDNRPQLAQAAAA